MRRCAVVPKQQSRTHFVADCEMYNEEWDVLEMREVGECHGGI